MILVVVPALNEAETVGAVVREIRATIDADVLVVDDGSTDDTAARAQAAGARVYSRVEVMEAVSGSASAPAASSTAITVSTPFV